jgi:hypothetical protein
VIVWLASYPRSGSWLFRIALHRLYRLRSTSIYPEPAAETQGVDEVKLEVTPETIASARSDEHPLFVKTHRRASAEDASPAICIARDGRDALCSYAHFARAQGAPGFSERSYEEALRVLIQREGGETGSWTEHVVSWLGRDAPTVLVRFGELVGDPAGAVAGALDGLGLEAGEPAGELPAFADLRRRNPLLFRRGIEGSWQDEMSHELHELFWEHHGAGMERLGLGRSAEQAAQVAGDRLPGLGRRDDAAVLARSDSRHLRRPGRADLGARLLRSVNPEGAEEAREADDLRSGGLKAQEQVPVEGEAKSLIHAGAGRLPGATTPEQGLLGHVVGPGEDAPIVAWEDPAADLAIVLVEQDTVAIDDVGLRVLGEVGSDVGE